MISAPLSVGRARWAKLNSVWQLSLGLALAACGSGDPDHGDPEDQVMTPVEPTSGGPVAISPEPGGMAPGGVTPLSSNPDGVGVSPTGMVEPTTTGVPPVVTPTGQPSMPGVNPDTTVQPTPVVPDPVAPGNVEPSPVEPGPAITPDPVEPTIDPTPVSPDPVTPDPNTGNGGFSVQDGKLIDVNGNPFLMRGVNDPYAWYSDGAQERMADIASVGANAVRVVLSSGQQWSRTSGAELQNIISWTKANKLVAVLEVHDATGFNDKDDFGSSHSPDVALEYWKSSDVRAAIDGQEAYVIVNIANEPFGNEPADASQWESWHAAAVSDLRAAGLKHTLMVDAANWGQDWEEKMLTGAPTIFAADPDGNTIFSIHMYEVYSSADKVWSYMETFLGHGLHLVVGEFAANHGSKGEVAEDAVMEAAQEYGVGYLGWSWSGNTTTDDLDQLDITAMFNVGSLTPWGDRLVNGANGLRETAQVCTCFN